MVEFFDYELSADAYKARLMMDILGVERTTRFVECYPARENRSDWYLAISARGEVPAIRDGGVVVDDPLDILVHLAGAHDPSGRWYPRDDPAAAEAVATWLAFAGALRSTAGAARLHDALLYHHIDVATARSAAHDLLRRLDEHLWFNEQQGFAWICPFDHPTIADIACFPDVMLAEEGRILLHEYPAIRRWTDRVKGIAGFSLMPGIFPH
jgi:glutathione S-transferase